MTQVHTLPSFSGAGEYPIDAPDRFTAALLQFVWSTERYTGNDVGDYLERNEESLCAPMEKLLPSPLPSPRTHHALQAIRNVLEQAKQRSFGAGVDPVVEAGLFLMRLTHLMEQHTLARVQQEMSSSLRGEPTPLMCVSPPARASSDDKSGAVWDSGVSSAATSTVRSRGRRFTLPEPSLSNSPSPSADLDASANVHSKTDSPRHQPPAPMWRFHAHLTLQVQQCMLRSMCVLDAAVLDNSTDDGGLCGILTHPRAARLQEIFVAAITGALAGARDTWKADPAAAGCDEAVREVSVVLERLRLAARAQQRAGAAPQLHVYELSAGESTRRSPPPFASRRRSSSLLWAAHEGQDGQLPADLDNIERCLGTVGAEYAAKLVAQQLWCAQKLLSQRFPSYAAPWDLLERARCFVESTRSPTPTVPRSDSNEHGGTYDTSASTATSGTPSPVRAPLHDGGTPPPFVSTTQRKGERPVDATQRVSPPLRSLSYSEERSEGTDATRSRYAEETLSPSRHLPESPPELRPVDAAGPRLLPAARCTLWENFVAARNIPVAATLIAIQQKHNEAVAVGGACRQQTAAGDRVDDAPFLQPVPLNLLARQQQCSKVDRLYSVETEHGAENCNASFPAKRVHARST